MVSEGCCRGRADGRELVRLGNLGEHTHEAGQLRQPGRSGDDDAVHRRRRSAKDRLETKLCFELSLANRP
jgi:hypothetical protein